jgi:hypothetical protein
MNNRNNTKNNISELEKSRQGYSDCAELLKKAQTVDQLKIAADHVLKIIKDCKLDYIQSENLEKLGFRCYEKIFRDNKEIIKNRKG